MKNLCSKSGLAAAVLIGIITSVIILGSIIYFTSSSQSETAETFDDKSDITPVDKNGDAVIGEKKTMPIMKDDMEKMITFSGTVLAGSAAPLLDFTKIDYETALKSDKLVVLYFYANWCPICKEEVPRLQAAFNELQTSRAVGFRVNFKDNETDKDEETLARQFGVSYQHTKVFLKNSERVLKAPDSWSKDRYLSEINKFLTN
ncbi:MAG: protein Trx [Parcubacteria group bacterium Gr01-1014_20]|nr:MAG: protein Trx [Parcubacteria group bacterium Gr01-1014_20]